MAKPSTSTAMASVQDNIDWSGDEEDWLEDFPLSTLEHFGGTRNTTNLPQSSSSSEESDEEDNDNRGKRRSASSKQKTYTPVQEQR